MLISDVSARRAVSVVPRIVYSRVFHIADRNSFSPKKKRSLTITWTMEVAVIIALTFVSAFTFVEDVYALPSDAISMTTTTARTTSPDSLATTLPTKDGKDSKHASGPKDLKEAIKAGKEARKSKKECMKDCGAEYDPICAHDPTDARFKPRSFGSLCALEVHNCEMGTKLTTKSKGECPGSSGVRLS